MEIVEIQLDTIDSTNLYAKRNSAYFSKEKMTCITAEEQTAGQGRYQRRWVSPRGVNLYVTFYFRLPIPTPQLTSLSQVMACSIATLLIQKGLQPKVKWPNDIQLMGKKVSGILCETLFHPTEIEVILGVGINVNMEQEDLFQINQPATSLKKETHQVWDKLKILKNLQTQFLSDLEIFQKKGFSPFHAMLEPLLSYKGEILRCFDGKRDWIGICHSLTSEGGLNLLLPDKTFHTLFSGDINNYSK